MQGGLICSLFTATQGCVLQDMGNTRRIWRVGLESNAEDIVLVISCHVQVIGVGLVMSQSDRCEVQLRDVLLFANSEAV